MKYFIYCRKSSESEDRQILSIDSQQGELERAFAGRQNIEIVGILKESYSAKAPGRPIFNHMVERIERGDAEGIIAWHPDRLARNSVDGGRLIYLLDRRVLKDLKFASFTFENNPQGKLMLSVLLGFSKYYVDSLSENVKRGNRTKVENGWRPNQAPLGYLNNKETKTIVKDPIHFPLIRRIYELMLTGAYTPKQIALKARDEWGFRTPRKKRIGGGPLALSSTHKILTNPFYAGIIVWNGQTYPGKHEPVITIDEFEQVQELLGRPGRPRLQRHTFAFTGMIRCGACGLMVTAEHKVNRFGSRYIYYHCTKRGLGPRCQEGSIELQELERQISRFLGNLVIPERVYRVVVAQVKDLSNHWEVEEGARRQSLETAIQKVTGELSELTGLRLRNLLADEEFVCKRRELQQEHLRLTQQLHRAQEEVTWFEPIEEVILFSNQAISWFQRGDPQTKRLILQTTGSNLVLKDKILSIEATKPFRQWPQYLAPASRLAVINDVRTFLSRDDDEVKRTVANIRTLKKRFEGDALRQAA